MVAQALQHDDFQLAVENTDCAECVVPMRYRFTISAAADSQILLRMLGFFSQRDLVPSAVEARTSQDALSVMIEQSDMPTETAMVIAAKIRALTMVSNVSLSIEEVTN